MSYNLTPKAKRKLTDGQQTEIRRMYFKAGLKREALCNIYNISSSTFSKIVGGCQGSRSIERAYG